MSWNQAGFFFALVKNYIPISKFCICSMVISNSNDHLSEFIWIYATWEVFLELNNTIIQLHLIIFKDKNKFSINIKISISSQFFFPRTGRKRLRTKPSWAENSSARFGLINSSYISFYFRWILSYFPLQIFRPSYSPDCAKVSNLTTVLEPALPSFLYHRHFCQYV